MDYEKKLKETLVNENADYEVTRWIEQTFPELKESEDEKIRKSLSAYFAKFKPDDMWDADFSFGDIVVWFEKQGEKNEEILVLKDQIESLHAAIKALKEAHKIELEKQGEQKSPWSEDDERIVTALMEGFRYHQLFNPKFGEVPNAEIISWIKSLKERLS